MSDDHSFIHVGAILYDLLVLFFFSYYFHGKIVVEVELTKIKLSFERTIQLKDWTMVSTSFLIRS